jgi:protein SPT2
MSGFAALMALSASQTKETQTAVQSALAQRQRKEELRRKQQEERERQERELQTKLRLRHFEAEKKEQERQQHLEQERQARERVHQRREEEQRAALRYGPKKAKALAPAVGPLKWPGAHSHARAHPDSPKRKAFSDEDDSLGPSLTREEKRERKLQAELKRTFHTARRSTHTGGYVKHGRRLPGGAIDVTTTAPGQAETASATQSIKARISAIPNTLTKLNIVKRDVRTIDEIRQDLAKVKVLAGDEAREFSDWFGKAKKTEPVKRVAQPLASAPSSGANTPASQTSKGSATAPGAAPAVVAAKKSSACGTSSPSGPKPAAGSSSVKSVLKSARRDSHTPPAPKPGLSSSTPLASTVKTPVANALSGSSRKRMRTPSLSDVSVPPKKRALSPNPARENLSNEIWKLFGKDRGSYVRRDVLSDDEDMEVDASILEREELRSSRIARKEEEEALEAERYHEHEKRKRKKEKEMRDRRG